MENPPAQQESCGSQPDIAAYLDGEMDETARARFARHLRACADCAAGLATQKRLLCALDVAFGEGRELRLPQNFAQAVTARAQSDMRGVRAPAEKRRALLFCALLSLVAFALLGAALSAAALAPAKGLLRAATSVLLLGGHTMADAGTSAVVILRAISGHFFAPTFADLLVWLLFVLALALLWKLMSSHRRARISG